MSSPNPQPATTDNSATTKSTPTTAPTECTRADPEEIIDHLLWTEGDFEVITADKVRFRVPFYYLFSASEVFRSAGEVSGDQTRKIELMDPDCETSEIFYSFLRLIKAGMLDGVGYLFIEGCLELKAGKLFTFLDKWDCGGLKAALCNELCLKIINEEFCPIQLFIVAARAKQSDLCKETIWYAGDHRWSGGTSLKSLDNVRSVRDEIVWDFNDLATLGSAPLPTSLSLGSQSSLEAEGR